MPKNHDLLIAASTIWVVVTAVLVMFMQAGFAFLEAGLTRMKNAAHIAGKNVLIFGICSLVYWLVGFGIAFGDGNGIVGMHGFAPSIGPLLAFIVDDEIAPAVVEAIADSARSGNESGDGLVWASRVENVTHNRTGRALEATEAR